MSIQLLINPKLKGVRFLVLGWFPPNSPIKKLTQKLSSRISESTTGYTFTPCVGSFTSPGTDIR